MKQEKSFDTPVFGAKSQAKSTKPAKSRRPPFNKLLIIIPAAVLLALGGGLGIYFATRDNSRPDDANNSTAQLPWDGDQDNQDQVDRCTNPTLTTTSDTRWYTIRSDQDCDVSVFTSKQLAVSFDLVGVASYQHIDDGDGSYHFELIFENGQKATWMENYMGGIGGVCDEDAPHYTERNLVQPTQIGGLNVVSFTEPDDYYELPDGPRYYVSDLRSLDRPTQVCQVWYDEFIESKLAKVEESKVQLVSFQAEAGLTSDHPDFASVIDTLSSLREN